jgi:UMF1 family MFS transporter
MATAGEILSDPNALVDDTTRQRRIRAWVLYDWANSAFVTTVIAAFLPAYYSAVAGATLPSEATATAYWSLTLSISIFIVAILSPILGTISDVMRGKKRFLAGFVLLGIIGSALLVLVNTGDWLMASLFLVLGRTGFSGANVFYDALLPHVARDEEQDSVSARGFALGYLGGGILLAINVAMFQFIPDTLFENAGIRLSFLSVAIWWAVFSIPIFRQVPEPPSATEALKPGENLIGVSFRRMWQTFRDLRQYRELFKYLVAFLIYNDPINTIIGLAVIYGAELRFGTLELVLALLLVQFVGVPFTLIFGRLPARDDNRRHHYLAYMVFNLVMLPLVAIVAAQVLPITITGQLPEPYETTADYYGEGIYEAATLAQVNDWEQVTITGEEQAGDGFLANLAGVPEDVDYLRSTTPEDRFIFSMNGAQLTITHDVGPDRGQVAVLVDGEALADVEDTDEGQIVTPVVIDMYNETLRYNEHTTIDIGEAGQHLITLVNMPLTNSESTGNVVSIAQLEVQPPVRVNSLPAIIGILLGLQLVGLVFAVVFGRFFRGLAERLTTRSSILLAIGMYCVIAVWGFFLNSTIEFWFLAWMVATVQGGSQALGRSLYAALSPSSKSGEFFGLFSILSKGASVVGAGLFAGAALLFDNSRPAILSLIVLFLLGAYLLTRVDIEEGKRLAREEDARVYGITEA